MAVLPTSRPAVVGLNESMILLAIENICASIQPTNAPRITTAGSSVNYSSAVKAVRRVRNTPSQTLPDEHPFIGVRRTKIQWEDSPSNKKFGRMQVSLTLRVMAQGAHAVDAALHALEDDVMAAMYSGFAMDPDDVSAAQGGYAHNLSILTTEDFVIEGTEDQGESVMTFEITFMRTTGKEAGHTGYNP